MGISSSAGGLEALSKLLRKVSPGSNLVFIIVQHMSPHHQSMLTELLSRECTLNVCEAKNGAYLQATQLMLTRLTTM